MFIFFIQNARCSYRWRQNPPCGHILTGETVGYLTWIRISGHQWGEPKTHMFLQFQYFTKFNFCLKIELFSNY